MNEISESVAGPAAFAPVVGLMLVSAGKLAETLFDAELGREGLSLAKMRGLRQLADAPRPCGLAELASAMGCAKSNATTMVERLRAQELVDRQANPNDARRVHVSLTPAGELAYARGQALATVADTEMLGSLSPSESRQLASLLLKIGR